MNMIRFGEVLNDLINEQNSLLNIMKNTTDEKDFKKIEKEVGLNAMIIKGMSKYIQFQLKKAESV